MPHPENQSLRLFDHGLRLVEGFEGFRPDWYTDPAGVQTIGFGWTGALPDGYRAPLSLDDGRRLLRETVGRYEGAVRRLVAVPLSQRQFDALVSFVYNLGEGRLAGSTLLRLLNAGDARAAAAEFDRWTYGGGVVLPGLVRRRAQERALFESGTPARPSTPLSSLRPAPVPLTAACPRAGGGRRSSPAAGANEIGPNSEEPGPGRRERD